MISNSLSGQLILPSFNTTNQAYQHLTQATGNFNEGYKLGLSYKSEWQGLSENIGFNSILISGQGYLYKSEIDQWIGGAFFVHDKGSAGQLQNNQFQIQSRYRRFIPLKKNNTQSLHVQMGAGLRAGSFSLDPSDLWFGQQFDIPNNEINTNLVSGETSLVESASYWSLLVSLSGSYTFRKYYKIHLGLTVGNINSPNISLLNSTEYMPRSYLGVLTFNAPLNKQMNQELQCIYQNFGALQNALLNYKIQFNMNDEDSSVYAGIGSRLGKGIDSWGINTIAFLFGVEFNQVEIQFNYESSLSAFSDKSNGGSFFELMAGYRIR